ncbi:hypothetical protein [Nonomuraea rhizosphaerae]|nr:hypothetical protein [Nonomuraea rhizosphaerae]
MILSYAILSLDCGTFDCLTSDCACNRAILALVTHDAASIVLPRGAPQL